MGRRQFPVWYLGSQVWLQGYSSHCHPAPASGTFAPVVFWIHYLAHIWSPVHFHRLHSAASVCQDLIALITALSQLCSLAAASQISLGASKTHPDISSQLPPWDHWYLQLFPSLEVLFKGHCSDLSFFWGHIPGCSSSFLRFLFSLILPCLRAELCNTEHFSTSLCQSPAASWLPCSVTPVEMHCSEPLLPSLLHPGGFFLIHFFTHLFFSPGLGC